MGWEGFAGEGRICEELSTVGALVAMDAEQWGGRGGGQLGEVLAQEGRAQRKRGRRLVWEEGQRCLKPLGGL